MRLRDNRGVSLLELIVVIAILAILATGTVSLFGLLRTADTAKAARLIDSVMEEVRMDTMSRSQKQYLYLYCIGDRIYLKASPQAASGEAGLDAESGRRLAKGITLFYKKETEGEDYLEAGESLRISFERSSGAFDPGYEYIRIHGPSHTSEITCIPETGRHWVK